MTTQDCLTYLLEAIALTFAALMIIDFATGLPLQPAAPIATPNPLDMSAVFDAVDSPQECAPMAHKLEAAVMEEICQPLVAKTAIAAIEDIAALPAAPIWEPLVLKTVIAAVAPTPDLSSMTRDAITSLAKEHGIGGYRPGQNRRRSKAELLAELGKLQLV